MKKKYTTPKIVASVFPVILVLGFIIYWINSTLVTHKNVVWPTIEWSVATPEEEGVDSSQLASMVDNLHSQNVHSFVLVRNGSIIAEGYNIDHEESVTQDVYSVTKSITSALIGKAIDDKLITDINQPINNYFPTLDQDEDTRKKNILLSQLLTMTSGLSWNNVDEASSVAMTTSTDWIKYVLELPLIVDPGSIFTYSNGGAHLLSAILEKVTGKPESEYAKDQLFNPLGIKNYLWQTDPTGNSIGAFGLYLTARDMAKFGYLYLNNGKWEGNQLISKKWIEKSTSQFLTFADSTSNQTEIGYGYLWWLREADIGAKAKTGISDMYSADGSGGQRIFVMPKQNMVAVFTANNQDPFFADSIVDKFIIPAIKSNKPLPANPEGNAQLKHNIELFKKLNDVS